MTGYSSSTVSALFLLYICLACTFILPNLLAQRTFGQGIPNLPINPSSETLVYNYSLPSTEIIGIISHFWSTACGGRSINWQAEGGITIYRLYVDGESTPSITFTPRMAVGSVFDPAGGSSSNNDGRSLVEPWGTDIIGKTSDWDGFYFKYKIPFYYNFTLTAQLPATVAPFNVYTIVHGTTWSNINGINNALTVRGYGPLPYGTRLVLDQNTNLNVGNLGFIPLVNRTNGNGLIYAMSISIVGHPEFFYLEGCAHLITPLVLPYINTTGVSSAFPGVVLSTGTEDYFSSSFYFHAGLFALNHAGVTHMCGSMAPHPVCLNSTSGTSEWSAYRVHEDDILYFENGVQYLLRNGDKADPIPYTGQVGKCYNLDFQPDGMSPGPSIVNTYAWIYLFPTPTTTIET